MDINPITRRDYPDPDVIRVGDTYYMATTTMHFMPGGEILRSRDLVHWEHLSYVYETLDHTPAQQLTGTQHIYGKGMWAASLRYHQGVFYYCFVANDTHQTYLFTATNPAGPWMRRPMEGFYHDCSLLFDDDGRVYIVYGNRDIYLTELKEDLSSPKPGGLHRLVVSDQGNPRLGYEGTHFYRINGKYYLFFIHSLRDRWRRTEACFVADSIDGEFVGGDILDDDLSYCDQGVAQGGIVDTPDGRWYAILFQDRGAVGRLPVLVPVTWKKDLPVFGVNGHIPLAFPLPAATSAAPLNASDDFTSAGNAQTHGTFGLKSCWQFNHEPNLAFTHLDRINGVWAITADKRCDHVTQARNTLTQRMCFPSCAAEVTLSAADIKMGDVAGLCALQGCYGLIGITRETDGFHLTMRSQEADEQVWASIPWGSPNVEFRAEADFDQMRDEVAFYYRKVPEERRTPKDARWTKLGITHKLYFKLDHFVGCRFGLFHYATQETGGTAAFRQFIYDDPAHA